MLKKEGNAVIRFVFGLCNTLTDSQTKMSLLTFTIGNEFERPLWSA